MWKVLSEMKFGVCFSSICKSIEIKDLGHKTEENHIPLLHKRLLIWFCGLPDLISPLNDQKKLDFWSKLPTELREIYAGLQTVQYEYKIKGMEKKKKKGWGIK